MKIKLQPPKARISSGSPAHDEACGVWGPVERTTMFKLCLFEHGYIGSPKMETAGICLTSGVRVLRQPEPYMQIKLVGTLWMRVMGIVPVDYFITTTYDHSFGL